MCGLKWTDKVTNEEIRSWHFGTKVWKASGEGKDAMAGGGEEKGMAKYGTRDFPERPPRMVY